MKNIDNENYEDEVKEIKKEDAFFGYEEAKPLSISSELILLNNDIVDDCDIICSLDNLPNSVNEEYVKKSIQLWEQLGINLHKIYSLRESRECSKLTSFDFDEENLVLVDVGQIPIVFNDSNDGELIESYLVQISRHHIKDELKKVIFHSIAITKLNDYLSSCLYAHEVSHSQLNSVYGSCKSRLNSEVIPILSEEIFAYNLDPSLETLQRDRNMSLYFISQAITMLYEDSLSYSDKLMLSMYIQSHLESVNMANIYLKGNKQIKNEMQQYIGRIFDGERSVEDMLDHYDSNYKDVPKSLGLIKKPFKK